MSTASFAPELAAPLGLPSRRGVAKDPAPIAVAPPWQRALRVAHLAIVLGGLYAVARGWVDTLAPRAHIGRRWAQRVLHSLGVEVRPRGHIPAFDAPVLLVANHISWLDSYALNTLSAARFVAKSEVREWPVIGAIATAFRTIFLRRGCYRAAARTAAVLTDALCAGEAVAVFPEGTTTTGDQILPFYPSMFQAAVMSGARVQPVAIRYRTAAGRPTTAPAYVGDVSVLTSVRSVAREPRVIAELIFCAPLESAGRTRKQLAVEAHTAILAALEGGSVRPMSPRQGADPSTAAA